MATKQVIVIRSDLKMRRGKEIAQGSHASMAFLTRPLSETRLRYLKFIINLFKLFFKKSVREWFAVSYAKVCVRADSEEQLLDIYNRAKASGLIAELITDSGRTEFDGTPTNTAVAIGPDYSENIDPITRDLKLY